MWKSLLFIIITLGMLAMNVGRWARSAAEGNWGEPVGDILMYMLLIYLFFAALRFFRRRNETKAKQDDTTLTSIVLVLSVAANLFWSDRAGAQAGSAADELLCRPGGSIDDCDSLVASKRYSGHALAVLLNDRGLVYYNRGESERAMVDYDAALAIYPGLGTAWYNRGLAQTRLGQLQQAIESFGRAGKLVPDRAAIWHSRGVVRAMTGDFAAALTDFDHAIGLDPQMALAWGYRGTVHVQRGDVAKGIADLKKSLSLNPKSSTFADILQNAEAQLAK